MADINEVPGGFDEPDAVTGGRGVRGGARMMEAAGGDGSASFPLPSFNRGGKGEGAGGGGGGGAIDFLKDVDLNVKIELGRTKMLIEDVLRLAEGSVVELDKLAGDPVDVFVNDQLVARGEVLVLNDNFCVRINEIVTGAEET